MNCPVCGIRLSEDGKTVHTLTGDVPIKGFETVRAGVKYRFDSWKCKDAFDTDPSLYDNRRPICE